MFKLGVPYFHRNWHYCLCHHSMQLRIYEARPTVHTVVQGCQAPKCSGIGMLDNLFGVRPSPTEHGLSTSSLPPQGLELVTAHHWPSRNYTMITNRCQ